MPGRRGIEALDASLCRRCQANEPNLTVRTEPLCKACFFKYVSTKIIKRMETFRVRNSEPGQPRTLLLPLSFGPGSTVLLHVLNQHLKGQVERTGRPGYRIHVLYVDRILSDSKDSVPYIHLLSEVKRRYPDHTYSTSSLSDICSSDQSSLFTELVDGTRMTHSEEGDNVDTFEKLLASLDSATSRTDMIQVLRRRLIMAFAKEHKCEAVLWGDSTTRLAERTLAETAKGRGISLPWIVADGESPDGVPVYYPLRELLSKEIKSYASLLDPPLDDLICKDEVKPAVSAKNTTIDDLMKQYFESVEQEYPTVVANVVRTTGKLQGHSLNEFEEQCELCDMPLGGQAPERSRLCYGCIRTLPRAIR